MRVCFISESFFPPDIGGAEISTSILADALSQEGVKIYVLTKKHKNYPIIEKKGNLKGKRTRKEIAPAKEAGKNNAIDTV